MKRVTRKEILKAIGCPHLSLRKSTYPCRDACFAFTYERRSQTLGTCWINVDQLNCRTLEEWVESGKTFVDEVEQAA